MTTLMYPFSSFMMHFGQCVSHCAVHQWRGNELSPFQEVFHCRVRRRVDMKLSIKIGKSLPPAA